MTWAAAHNTSKMLSAVPDPLTAEGIYQECDTLSPADVTLCASALSSHAGAGHALQLDVQQAVAQVMSTP